MNTMTPSSAAISQRQISFHFSVEIIWIFARGCRGLWRGQRNTRRWTLGPGLWFCKTLASRLSRAVVTVIFVSRRVHGRRVDREAFHCLQLPVWLLFFSFFFWGKKIIPFFRCLLFAFPHSETRYFLIVALLSCWNVATLPCRNEHCLLFQLQFQVDVAVLSQVRKGQDKSVLKLVT